MDERTYIKANIYRSFLEQGNFIFRIPFSTDPSSNTASLDVHSPKENTGRNDNDFDPVKSTLTNTVSEKANLLPAALKESGYHPNFMSGYLKSGGVVSLGWTAADMKQDWDAYSSVNLVGAWKADLIPLEAGFIGGLLGGYAGKALDPKDTVKGQMFAASFFTIGAAVAGDWIKNKVKSLIPKDSKTK